MTERNTTEFDNQIHARMFRHIGTLDQRVAVAAISGSYGWDVQTNYDLIAGAERGELLPEEIAKLESLRMAADEERYRAKRLDG